MLKKSMPLGSISRVLLPNAPGDLRATGWEGDDVYAKTDGEALDLVADGDALTVSCDGDLILNLPRRVAFEVGAVAGDADVRELPGGVALRSVEGDLSLRMVGAVKVGAAMGDMDVRESGPLSVDSVHADLSVRGCKGDLSVHSAHGDVSLHDVQGNVSLDSVEDDLFVRNAAGDLRACVEGDAVMYLQPAEGRVVEVTSEDDILLHLSPRASAALTLSAGEADDIRVEMPGVPKRDGTNPRSLVLGNGGAAIHLKAEGDVMVTSRESDYESAAEFDFGGSWPLPADFSERINRRVQEATRRAEAAVRRAEERVHRHPGRHFSFNWMPGRGVPVPPMPPSEPVSDEERMTILRMLQEKKIRAEDAEKLLSALEGNH